MLEQLSGAILGEPLARHTSLRVGGPADMFVVARSCAAAVQALRVANANGLPVLPLGGGSNLLPADAGVEGLVLKYVAATYALQANGDEAVVVAEAGCSLAGLARRLARLGWAGLEWAVNVPGTVGGAVVNNAGAFGSCVAEHLLDIEAVDSEGRTLVLANRDLGYAYRSSRLKQHALGTVLVLRARFRVARAPAEHLAAIVAANQERRTLTQPRQLSAGSVFANPPGDYAGRLIEQAGLKGLRRGGAQISSQHANFIVNLGGATAREVYDLMRTAQDTVWSRAHLWLQPEIELIGRWSPQDVAALRAGAASAS